MEVQVDRRSHWPRTLPQKFTQSLHETDGVLKPPIPELVERIYALAISSTATTKSSTNHETQDGWFSTAISETAKGFQPEGPEGVLPHHPWGRIPPALRDDALDYFQRANACERTAGSALSTPPGHCALQRAAVQDDRGQPPHLCARCATCRSPAAASWRHQPADHPVRCQ